MARTRFLIWKLLVLLVLFIPLTGCSRDANSEAHTNQSAPAVRSQPSPGAKPTVEAGSLKLLLVGDVMLGRLVNDVLTYKPPDYPWGDTLPLFREADVRICNLECVISDRGRPWSATPKVFHFRSDAKNLAVLQKARIDGVSLGNNHALDYGYDALLETLGLFKQAGIHYAGAGTNLAEACRTAVIETGGVRLGLIAFTDNEPVWEATASRPGTCYAPIDVHDKRGRRVLELVTQAKAQVDVLVVSTHWGPNWGYQPPDEHVSFGRALIDAGADVVFGHSAHIVRGIEMYHGRPIIYSAGDFVDDYAVDPVERNDQSFIFVLEVSDGSVRGLSLYPTVIRHFQARLAQAGMAEEISGKMRSLCSRLGTRTHWDSSERCLRISAGTLGARPTVHDATVGSSALSDLICCDTGF
jgi:poly-gamma-glutamate synthesis protein (capsule biosynthesis protein)